MKYSKKKKPLFVKAWSTWLLTSHMRFDGQDAFIMQGLHDNAGRRLYVNYCSLISVSRERPEPITTPIIARTVERTFLRQASTP